MIKLGNSKSDYMCHIVLAIQVQESWAYANDVNLLAAGASNPAIGNV